MLKWVDYTDMNVVIKEWPVIEPTPQREEGSTSFINTSPLTGNATAPSNQKYN